MLGGNGSKSGPLKMETHVHTVLSLFLVSDVAVPDRTGNRLNATKKRNGSSQLVGATIASIDRQDGRVKAFVNGDGVRPLAQPAQTSKKWENHTQNCVIYLAAFEKGAKQCWSRPRFRPHETLLYPHPHHGCYPPHCQTVAPHRCYPLTCSHVDVNPPLRCTAAVKYLVFVAKFLDIFSSVTFTILPGCTLHGLQRKDSLQRFVISGRTTGITCLENSAEQFRSNQCQSWRTMFHLQHTTGQVNYIVTLFKFPASVDEWWMRIRFVSFLKFHFQCSFWWLQVSVSDNTDARTKWYVPDHLVQKWCSPYNIHSINQLMSVRVQRNKREIHVRKVRRGQYLKAQFFFRITGSWVPFTQVS